MQCNSPTTSPGQPGTSSRRGSLVSDTDNISGAAVILAAAKEKLPPSSDLLDCFTNPVRRIAGALLSVVAALVVMATLYFSWPIWIAILGVGIIVWGSLIPGNND